MTACNRAFTLPRGVTLILAPLGARADRREPDESMTDLRHETLQPLCGAYLAGAMQPAEEAEFERHLAGCPECMDECDRLGEASAGLALLPAADVEELLAEPWPPSPTEMTADEADEQTAKPAGPTEAAVGKPAGRKPVATTRPPARPRDKQRRRRRLIGSVLAAVLVVGLGVGVVVKVAERPTAPIVQTDQVGRATAEGADAGARLSVTINDDGVRQVRATVAGLTQGERYKLYAIDTEGTNHLVAAWTGDAGAERVVTGKTDVPLADLAFFAVTHGATDSAVVSARVNR
jgi:hypothetical protein